MIAPITKNLTIFRGITFKLKFKAMTKNCCDGSGLKTPLDLTDYDIFMQIRKSSCGEDEHELVLDVTTPMNMIEVIEPASGEISIRIPGSVTKHLPLTRGLRYWIVLRSKTDPDDTIILMVGDVCINKPVVIIP